MRTKITCLLAAAGALALTLSGCGSNSLSGGQPSSGPSVSVSQNTGLNASLPAKIRSAGTIVIGTDASYAPNEFTEGNKIVGSEIDLFNAVAAKLGVKATFKSATFDTIIPGVASNKYDMGVSSFTITKDRLKTVAMVSYFSAGTQWVTAAGNPKNVDPNNPCGKTISVQNGTVQQLNDLPARQKKCGSNKINILPYDKQDQATAAVASGRADGMLADSPVAAYAVKQSAGKLATAGNIYDSAPYGVVLPKSDTELGKVIASALTQLKSDGSYDKILTRWGTQGGAVQQFQLQPTS